MRLAQYLTILRAWCKQCLPARKKTQRGPFHGYGQAVGMRGSMARGMVDVNFSTHPRERTFRSPSLADFGGGVPSSAGDTDGCCVA